MGGRGGRSTLALPVLKPSSNTNDVPATVATLTQQTSTNRRQFFSSFFHFTRSLFPSSPNLLERASKRTRAVRGTRQVHLEMTPAPTEGDESVGCRKDLLAGLQPLPHPGDNARRWRVVTVRPRAPLSETNIDAAWCQQASNPTH